VLTTAQLCLLSVINAALLSCPAAIPHCEEHQGLPCSRMVWCCLVRCAGASQHALAAETTDSVAEALLEINTLAPMRLTHAALPHMLKRCGAARQLRQPFCTPCVLEVECTPRAATAAGLASLQNCQATLTLRFGTDVYADAPAGLTAGLCGVQHS
jgi:NAD(P)-dependent dehydrogenase (short-subunit alcohol dehydrogenase family)